jgi:hypothetical protein
LAWIGKPAKDLYDGDKKKKNGISPAADTRGCGKAHLQIWL